MRWLFGASLCVMAAVCAAAGELRFVEPDSPPDALGTGLLSPQEREFIAALPEIRVGVPLVQTRPYQTISDDGVVSGIHAEMLAAMARTFGLRLKAVPMPDWPSAFEAMRRHDIDLLMSVGITPRRLQDMVFTLGITPSPAALFGRRGSHRPDLERARFAVERGYLADELLRALYPKASFETHESTLDALRAVAAGRAEYYVGNLLAASALLAREPVADIEAVRLFGYGSGQFHFGIRKDWAPLAPILDKASHSLRARPHAELVALLSTLPPNLRVPLPIALDTAEAALLSQRPLWRVGAVRGLALLNDIDTSGQHGGLAAEYTAQVALRLGVSVQPVGFDNVAAMLDALRDRRIDIVPFLTRTPERERDFAFSNPYVEMPYLLVAASNGPLYWDLNSLRGKRVALAQAHPVREVLATRYPDVRIVDAADGNAAIDLVAQGKAEAAVEVKLFANLRINSAGPQVLRAVAAVSELPAQFHFATARADAQLLPLINRALADIAPAERERMLRRWVAIDLDPPFPWRRYVPLMLGLGAGLLVVAAATSYWMRRLAREVHKRRRSEQLLNDIATTVPGVAFRHVLNDDGTVRHTYFTPGTRSFLGIDLDPKRGVLEVLAPALQAEHVEAALEQQQQSLATGAPFKMTAAYRHPDGRERWLHAEAVRSTNVDGRAAWTGFIVDVTTERELQQRLRADAEERNLLLASASHELRAPTHTLSLALQSVREERLEPSERDALRIAKDSARTLGQLLNDVLEAARPQRDEPRLAPRDFDLHALIDEMAGAWRAAAASKGLRFEVSVSADVPRVALLDPLRLKQILTNLLSNACKYTTAGSVGLRVEFQTPARLRMIVSDTGAGIDLRRRGRLFEPFAAAQSSVAEGSSGLGLSICQRLVQLMNGSLEIDSAPGRGTRVELTVPLHAPAAALGTAPNGDAAVLVCDDDDSSRILLSALLQSAGYRVDETADAADALQRWREGRVRALITDLHMPNFGGVELIAALRAEEAGRSSRTSVIVCSGSAFTGTEAPFDAALIDGRLVKPVEVSLLIRTLQQLGVHGAPTAQAPVPAAD